MLSNLGIASLPNHLAAGLLAAFAALGAAAPSGIAAAPLECSVPEASYLGAGDLGDGAQPAIETQDEKVKIDASRIYYGTPNAWTRAGVVDGAKVLKATAAWKEIQRKGIKKGSPEYDLYKHRAQKEMHAAIEKVAKSDAKQPYDLVGELGSIVIKGSAVPDLTGEVVSELGG